MTWPTIFLIIAVICAIGWLLAYIFEPREHDDG